MLLGRLQGGGVSLVLQLLQLRRDERHQFLEHLGRPPVGGVGRRQLLVAVQHVPRPVQLVQLDRGPQGVVQNAARQRLVVLQFGVLVGLDVVHDRVEQLQDVCVVGRLVLGVGLVRRPGLGVGLAPAGQDRVAVEAVLELAVQFLVVVVVRRPASPAASSGCIFSVSFSRSSYFLSVKSSWARRNFGEEIDLVARRIGAGRPAPGRSPRPPAPACGSRPPRRRASAGVFPCRRESRTGPAGTASRVLGVARRDLAQRLDRLLNVFGVRRPGRVGVVGVDRRVDVQQGELVAGHVAGRLLRPGPLHVLREVEQALAIRRQLGRRLVRSAPPGRPASRRTAGRRRPQPRPGTSAGRSWRTSRRRRRPRGISWRSCTGRSSSPWRWPVPAPRRRGRLASSASFRPRSRAAVITWPCSFRTFSASSGVFASFSPLACLDQLELGADVAVLEILQLLHRLLEAALLLGDDFDLLAAGAVGEVVLRLLDLAEILPGVRQIGGPLRGVLLGRRRLDVLLGQEEADAVALRRLEEAGVVADPLLGVLR